MPAAGDNSVEAMPTAMAQTDFAVHARKMITLITKLRALGAEADIDLPRIAVIGNQSAGKSSLMEAISGITVPRAPGKACTSNKPVRATPSRATTARVVSADATHDSKARRHVAPGEAIASAAASKFSDATGAFAAPRREGVPTPQTAGNAKKQTQTQKGKQKQKKTQQGSVGAKSTVSDVPAVRTALRASASEFTPTFGTISPSAWGPSPTLVESAGAFTRRAGSPTLTELAYGRPRSSDIEDEW